MKKIFSNFLIISFLNIGLYAQDNVGIGTTTPDQSAILEIQSTDKGILIPRVSTAQRNSIANPAIGLFVYDTDFSQFWYFDGTLWVQAIGPTGPTGPSGADGQDGNDGLDGNDGIDGIDGQDGSDGVGIVSTIDNQNGTFTINYSDGSSFTTNDLTGPQGQTGVAGPAGPQGTQGATGPQGNPGPIGPQGSPGQDGQDGLILDGSAAGNTTYWNGSQWVVNSSNIYNNGGYVGINNNNPSYRLHVGGMIKSDGITESSDERLKENIETLQHALKKVLELRGVSYSWNEDAGDNLADSGTKLGLIAQEVEKVIPEVVDTDSEGFKSIQYSVLVALLIEAIKEQQQDYISLRNDMNKIFVEIENLKLNQGLSEQDNDELSLSK